MANNHETLTSLFTDIADAIREKTGGTESIVADQFPEVIAEIDTQEDLDAEMVDQDDLIEAIAAGLVGKALPGGGSSGGSSGSGGGDTGNSGVGCQQSEVYDMVTISRNTDMVYTVPRDGTLFVVSNFSKGLTGFEVQIKKSHTVLGNSSDFDFSQSVFVHKKDVVLGETVTIPSANVITCLLLAESGSNVADCSRVVRRFSAGDADHTTIEIVNEKRRSGFCFLSQVASLTANGITVMDGVSKAAFYPYETSGVGWGTPGYLSGISDRFTFKANAGGRIANSYELVSFNLSKGVTPVYDIDPTRIKLAAEKTFSFDTNKKVSITSEVDGCVVFVGAYRRPDAFPLDGFTILEQFETHIGSNEQIIVIAYKPVTVGETVGNSTATEKRFGGSFFQTSADLSKAKVTVGCAARENGNIVFPMPGEFDSMFGIAGYVQGGSDVGEANVEDIYVKQETTAQRLTAFYANEFTGASGASDISFPFTDSDGYEGDVQGIWAKFTFAD